MKENEVMEAKEKFAVPRDSIWPLRDKNLLLSGSTAITAVIV